MRFLLFALIEVLLFAHLTWAQEPAPFPGTSPTKSSFQRYVDPANGVTFRYPASWHLNQGGGAYIPPVILKNPADPTDPYNPTAYVALVGRDAKRGPYSNSNFINAWFLYRIAPHLNQEQCYAQASAPLQNSNESDNWKVDWRMIDGVRFYRGMGTDGGLCNETTEDFYAAFHVGRCYLFEKQVNTICPHSDGLRDITPRELGGINQQLDAVMLSVRFTSASAPTPNVVLPNYDRTIHLLETGVQQHWDQEHFQKAFRAAFGPAVLTGQRLTACGVPVLFLLKPRTIWDEQMPIPFDSRARQTLEDCRPQRTPVLPQHMWYPMIGTNYRVLWQRTIQQTIE